MNIHKIFGKMVLLFFFFIKIIYIDLRVTLFLTLLLRSE